MRASDRRGRAAHDVIRPGDPHRVSRTRCNIASASWLFADLRRLMSANGPKRPRRARAGRPYRSVLPALPCSSSCGCAMVDPSRMHRVSTAWWSVGTD